MLTEDTPRKHRQQMSEGEIRAVESFVHFIKGWAFSPHFRTRADERKFTLQSAANAMALGTLIEARPDGRVLMRHDTSHNESICVVGNVRTRKIITVFFNHPDDRHDTLNLGAYRWKQDAQEVFHV